MNRIFFLMLCFPLLSGCVPYRPRTPVALSIYSSQIKTELSNPTWLASYNALPQGTADQQASKILARNRLINEVVWTIDNAYDKFEVTFYSGKAEEDITGDFLELGIAGATSITGGARVKSILGMAASTVAGGKASIDSHWLDQQTRFAIVAQMEALRATQMGAIQQGMTEGLQAYPLEQGIRDCQTYYSDGSVVAALQAIATTAGSQATAAKQALQQMRH